MKLFSEYRIKDLTLKNRIVMPPMCMYSADTNGFCNDFHFTHYTTRALGGAGLIIMEATAISPEGRISDNDLGLWDNKHIDGLKNIVDACHAYGTKMAIQINHAGRKYESKTKDIFAPSSIKFNEHYQLPKELTKDQIKNIVEAFKAAAKRADEAGFDALELHGAHGYLIDQFLSPLTNHRDDEYGGSFDKRLLFIKEVISAVKSVWPENKPLLLRVLASDYDKDGILPDTMVKIIDAIKMDIDIVHVSSGGVAPVPIKAYPGYQVPFSEIIKTQCNVPTVAVGLITSSEMAEEILCNNRADLVSIGRELLRNPYWPILSAKANGISGYIPVPYERSF